MTHKKRHCWTPPKLVSMMMGFCLSLIVSLPVFALPYEDLGDGNALLSGVKYQKCSHCSTTEIYSICSASQWGHGHGVPQVDKSTGKACVCSCGCVSSDTMITMADGSQKRADQLVEGEAIAIMTMGGLKSATIYMVTKSKVVNYLATQVTFSDETVLTASENHTVLNEDDELITLEALSIGDRVRRHDGQLISVTANKLVGYDKLLLINVIVSTDSVEPIEHVYITNGLFSGDWLLQVSRDKQGGVLEVLWDRVDLSFLPEKSSPETVTVINED